MCGGECVVGTRTTQGQYLERGAHGGVRGGGVGRGRAWVRVRVEMGVNWKTMEEEVGDGGKGLAEAGWRDWTFGNGVELAGWG